MKLKCYSCGTVPRPERIKTQDIRVGRFTQRWSWTCIECGRPGSELVNPSERPAANVFGRISIKKGKVELKPVGSPKSVKIPSLAHMFGCRKRSSTQEK